MQEQQIRVSTALAAALWMMGVGLVVAGIALDRDGVPELGVLLGVVAAVIQVRGFIVCHESRLRDAFETGRDYEQELRAVP